MQRKLLFLFLFSFCGLNILLFAQDGNKKAEFESFKKQRVAFITKVMQLTDDEAKVFWPLCNELQEKKFAINQEIRRTKRAFTKVEKEGKTHSQEEYLKLVKLIADFQMQEAQLNQEYIDKFAEVISAQKIFLYQQAEQQFARRIMLERQPANRNKS